MLMNFVDCTKQAPHTHAISRGSCSEVARTASRCPTARHVSHGRESPTCRRVGWRSSPRFGRPPIKELARSGFSLLLDEVGHEAPVVGNLAHGRCCPTNRSCTVLDSIHLS